MHLRSLRLRGFKSFAEPVELRFERGVAVIVGPNGSGKSNVAEALQWAMASQPPSELRAATGMDVLFNGSTRRAPSGFAEVELVLDNEDGGFGSGRPEVSVMRRLTREGDSSYLLNRVQVRRLDVQEALADAGLGRELHAIVSQGRVEEILLSKPADRRGYIEEAAGLGKYKRRRHRALQKLARTDANLARARDLEAELRGRLRPLALQASAAERAEALGLELAQARADLYGSQIAGARRVRARIATDLEKARAAGAAIEAEARGVAAERERVEGELSGLLAQQEAISQRYFGLGAAGERLDARREALAERAAMLADDHRRALARARRLDDEAAAARERAATAADELEAAAARLAGAASEDAEARLAAASAEATQALEALLAARRELAEVDGQLARATREAADAGERAAGARARAVAASGEAQAAAARRSGFDAGLQAAEDAARTATEEQAAGGRALAARAAADAAREEERGARGSRASASARLEAARARAKAADAALQRGDGLRRPSGDLGRRGSRSRSSSSRRRRAWRRRSRRRSCGARARPSRRTRPPRSRCSPTTSSPAARSSASTGCPPARPPRCGEPLAAHVTPAAGCPPALLDGVHLVDDADDLRRATRGIVVARDGRGIDADRGIAFRGGGSAAAIVALRAEHAAVGSTSRAATSSPPRIRSSTRSAASTRSTCSRRSGSRSRARSAPSSARIPTSSWSARSATRRRPRSRSTRRSRATSCSRRSTPTTRAGAVTRLVEMEIEPFLRPLQRDRHPRAAPRAHALPERARCRTSPRDYELKQLGLDRRAPRLEGAPPALAALPGARPRSTSTSARRWAGARRSTSPAAATPACKKGFIGRRGIYELMVIDDAVGPLDPQERRRADHQARRDRAGMDTLRDDGARKVLRGLTTVEEVLAATQEDVIVDE